MRQSKFKNVIGDTARDKWVHFDICTANTEGRLLAGNSRFLAASWNTQHGGIAILDINNPCSVKPDIPLIKGFKGPVLDLEFSPFRSDLLATASEDCSVKLYQIPEGGLTSTITQEAQNFQGHYKKSIFVNFNPVASDCLLSASFDNTVKVWNCIKGEEFANLELKDIPTSVFWNCNGSLIAACCKNKTLNVLDPRTKKSVLCTVCHDSAKNSKLCWKDNDTVLTVGFTKSGAKEVKEWDIRKVNEDGTAAPLSTTGVDHSSAVATPYFDTESKLLYTLGKGETTIHIFDFNLDKVVKCIDFSSQEPSISVAMLDRRCVDYKKCEVDRFVKYHNNCLYTVIFKIPRKVDIFDESLYPPIPSGEPASTFDAWAGGETKEPIRKKINEISKDFVGGQTTFQKAEAGGSGDKVKTLEAKIAELENKVKELTEENEKLKKDIEAKKASAEAPAEGTVVAEAPAEAPPEAPPA